MFSEERRNMKLAARKSINGKVLSVFWAVILANIITIAISVIGGIVEGIKTSNAVSSFFSVLSFLGFLAQGFLSVGFCVYLLKLTGVGNEETSDVFSQKRNFVNILKTRIVVTVYVFIGLILLIVPGIIMALKYSQTNYVLAEHPEYNYKQAMQESARLMEGCKWEFLLFNLSFILWWIAVPFTFMLLLIYLLPYVNTANTNYYRYLKYKVYKDSTTVFDPVENIPINESSVF